MGRVFKRAAYKIGTNIARFSPNKTATGMITSLVMYTEVTQHLAEIMPNKNNTRTLLSNKNTEKLDDK